MKAWRIVFAVIFLGSVLVLFLIQHNKQGLQTVSVSPIPTNIQTVITNQPSPAVRISAGNKPNIPLQLPNNFVIHVFASSLDHPRDLEFSPGGTLLVSNPNTNQVIAMPDKNNDGVADSEKIVISSGDHVHGLAFYNGKLFVAEVKRVVRYNWDEQTLTASFDKVLFTLPDNSDHNSRTITFDKAGNMYVSVGSTCNVCVEQSNLSATVLISNANGDNPRIFAKGLRNAPFLAMNPKTNELWATEMGRDYLGDNLPPDEIDIVREGKDYGWPYCYADRVHDNMFDPNNAHSCTNTELPIYDIPAHSAPLGLAFINSTQFPTQWQGDLLVSYHGSWNRSVPTGYKVVHMKVNGNTITQADDFLSGFLQNSNSLGRPVDLIFDKSGNLYISDDKAGNVYIVQKSQ